MTDISDEEINLKMPARKTLLFDEEITWVKKERNEDFRFLMGCFDGVIFYSN